MRASEGYRARNYNAALHTTAQHANSNSNIWEGKSTESGQWVGGCGVDQALGADRRLPRLDPASFSVTSAVNRH
ncbi:unnamed protein product, partial [Brenthis ino]